MNPSVEYAVQYAVAASLATLEMDKNDLIHKLLLQGGVYQVRPEKGKLAVILMLVLQFTVVNDMFSFHQKCFLLLSDVVRGKALEEVIGDVLNGKWDHERTTQKRILQFKHFGDKVIVEEQVESGDMNEIFRGSSFLELRSAENSSHK
ncbi:unnamed protein product [Camellia sinensis]